MFAMEAMRDMLTLTSVLFISLLLAQEQFSGFDAVTRTPWKPTTTRLLAQEQFSELDAVRLENIQLRLELLQVQAEKLKAKQEDIVRRVCADAKIPLESCLIDPIRREVKAEQKQK